MILHVILIRIQRKAKKPSSTYSVHFKMISLLLIPLQKVVKPSDMKWEVLQKLRVMVSKNPPPPS